MLLVMVLVGGQTPWQSSLCLLLAIVAVQTAHSQIGQRVGATVFEQQIVGSLEVDDGQVPGRLISVPSVAGCVVLMVFDDARCKSFALSVQEDSRRQLGGDLVTAHTTNICGSQ